MSKVYLKTPTIDELHYRQEWIKDPFSMSYNAGYKLDVSGYDYQTGTINKTFDELKEWYDKWIGHEPNKFFAYIYDFETNIPVGEVYFYYQEDLKVHGVGILITAKNRGKGYSHDALIELEHIAFEKYNVDVLSDIIPTNRNEAINTFKKAGFISTDLVKKESKFDKEIESRQFIITKEMYKNIW